MRPDKDQENYGQNSKCQTDDDSGLVGFIGPEPVKKQRLTSEIVLEPGRGEDLRDGFHGFCGG